VVEVLSPSSRSIDFVRKPRRYREFGVPEYWVADPAERVMWRFAFGAGKTDGERVADRLVWRPDAATHALEIDLADGFRDF
jgi:Uma2 family endonuclease